MEPFVKFDNYEILGEIARGGMGIIYRARQSPINRIVALKVLKECSQELTERFRQEVEAIGKLEHPNIVRVYDAGEIKGTYYFTMEYIDGQPLSELISKKKLPENKILSLMGDVISAVHFAHEQGVVHRDLKPANILVASTGVPKVTDFGLAKVMDRKKTLTQSGTLMGTPYYMSPEQVKSDKQIDRRTDVYSLGVILYEIFTHHLPFIARSPMELYRKIMEKDPILPHIHNARVHRDLEAIIMKAMEKDPKNRYSTAKALADDIAQYLKHEPVLARPITMWTLALKYLQKQWILVLCGCLIILSTVLLILVLQRKDESRDKSNAKNTHASKDKRTKTSIDIKNIKTTLEEAQQKYGERKFPEAQTLAEKVLAMDPEQVQALLLKGMIYYFTDNSSGAVVELNKVIEKADKNMYKIKATAYLYRGAAKWKIDNLRSTLDDFNQAITADPKWPVAYYYRAWAYYLSNNREKSCDDVKYALELDQRYFIAHCALALLYYHQERYEDAQHCLDHALEIKPKDYLPYSMKILLYAVQSDFTACVKNMETLIYEVQVEETETHREFTEKGPFFLTDTELQNTFGQDMMAKSSPKLLEQMYTKTPAEFAKFFADFSKILCFVEQYDQVLMLCSQCLMLFPDNTDLIKSRGIALLGKGSAQQALADLNRVIEKNPQDWEAFQFRGNAYLQLGQKQKAIEDWQASLRMNPKQPRLQTRLGKLQREDFK